MNIIYPPEADTSISPFGDHTTLGYIAFYSQEILVFFSTVSIPYAIVLLPQNAEAKLLSIW